MFTYLACSGASPFSQNQINTMIERCAQYLPDAFQENAHKVYISRDAQAFLAVWSHRENTFPEPLSANRSDLRFLSGYVADFAPTEHRRLLKSTPWRHGVADFTDSPGGIYSLIAIDKKSGRISALQSRSGINPVYYTHSNRIVAISDRAILSHVAAKGSRDVQLGFVPSLLQSNFLVDGTTPYSDTKRLNVHEAVSASSGALRITERKLLPAISVGRDIDERIDRFTSLLINSIKPYHWTGRPVLRISGGKDSRLLAALLFNQGVDCVAENHNPPDSVEGFVADRVAELCEIRTERNYPQPTDIIQNFRVGTVDRGGMPQSVPLHYPYPNSVRRAGVAMTLGHAHHPRGGFARTMGEPAGGYLQSIENKFSSPLIREEFRSNTKLIRQHLMARDVPHLLHHSYWAYSDIRVPYYLSIHYTEYASHCLPIYPLLDEKILLFCEGMVAARNGFFELVSEMLMYGATVSLNPALAPIPLANNKWRFDVGTPNEKFSEGYAERTCDIRVQTDASESTPPVDFRAIDQEVFHYLRHSRHYDFIQSFLCEDFVRYIEGQNTPPVRVLAKTAKETAYAAFGCAAFLDEL